MADRTTKKKKKTSSGKTVRKTRAKKVIESFTLSKEERLELEVLKLKEGQINERRAIIQSQQQAWGRTIQSKYGIDLQEFLIDVDSGECNRRPPPALVPPKESEVS